MQRKEEQQREWSKRAGDLFLRGLLNARAKKTVSDLLEIAPKVRIPALLFLLPLILTVLGVLCDGLALALLGPLFRQVLVDTSPTGNQAEDVVVESSFIYEIPRLLGLGSDATLVGLICAILFLSIIAIPLRKIGTMLTTLTMRNVDAELETALMKRILTFGKLYFQVSDLSVIHELRNRATQFVTGGIQLIHRCVEAGAFLVFYLGVMFTISWQLSLYFLFAGIVMSIGTAMAKSRVQARTAEGVELSKLLRRQVATCFQGIDIIKANALEQPVVEKVHQRAIEKRDHDQSLILLTTRIAVLQDLCGLLIVFFAVWLYVYIAPAFGAHTAANAAVFLILARRLLDPIAQLHRTFLDGAKIAPGLAALQIILDLDDKHIPFSGSLPVPEGAPEIEVVDLTFAYPSQAIALRDISFRITAGSTVAVVGRSGAGKSTLMKLLLKSFEAPPGSIFISGVDIRDMDREAWCHNLAYVPQNAALFTGTLRENLTVCLNRVAEDSELQEILAQVGLAHVLERLDGGLDGTIGEEGNRLSRGEQQRLSVARMMLQDPKVVLVDEATSSLDVYTERMLTKTLKEFCRNRTTMIIAHRLATIRHADTILVLDKGLLVEHGTFDELVAAKGLFATLWNMNLDAEGFATGGEEAVYA